jgi:hypothetical protein
MNNETISFQEVYKLPLKRMRTTKVFDSGFNMAFDFTFSMMSNMFPGKTLYTLEEDQKNSIVDKLNGIENGVRFEGLYYDEEDTTICIGSQVFIIIRGWGYMTGSSENALQMSPEEATNVQKQFANYIIERLST